MKIYGYNIVITETIGHGMPWWDEYYESSELKQLEVRVFTDKMKRDAEMMNALEKFKDQYNGYNYPELQALGFETNIE